MPNDATPSGDTPLPSLPLPPSITSETPGTWAYSTMSVRVANIARRTLEENDFPPEIAARVGVLIADIPESPLRLLRRGAPDAMAWESYVRPYLGQNWLTPPWFLTETYFYRRLIEATGYYVPGPGFNLDPFLFQKEQSLLVGMGTIAEIAGRLSGWLGDGHRNEHLAALLAITLWGNRADLSLWPAGEEGEQPSDVNWESARAHNLADDTEQVLNYLDGRSLARIDIIADNAGIELVADLALADYLLSTSTAAVIRLHLKPHPTFVSDAMIKDVYDAIGFLQNAADDHVAAFGSRLADHLSDGRLVLERDAFWVSPLPFWELPTGLRQKLSESDLLICKGDANYRRLLGDRMWPFSTPFAEILSYAPAPLLALRVLKAELACGLRETDIERLNREDPDWLVNGRWGVIQFALPA